MADISLHDVRTIIRKTLEKGRALDMKPLAVVVLDAGGHVQAFEREDDAPPGRFAIAHGKAYGVVMMGIAGTGLMKLAAQRPTFLGALNGVYDGQLVPVSGGILVRSTAGKIVGSVGVTGDSSENDALAGVFGIQAAGLVGEA